ncbi:cytochrome p450 family 4 [Holotrichia oblita]|uniref:Cytochrome p450 family 4 n=1 Tax=Holotrichia oblita TaxID=644536 RepID=A0ACB9TGX5_HOLOL|nr:cytochrome p450 family 4 [Holotrichia oblita]
MLQIILIIVFLPLILWLLYWYYNVGYFEKHLKTVPGPSRFPLLGNVKDLGTPITFLDNLYKFSLQYNGTFKMYLGSRAEIFLVNTEHLEFLLSSNSILVKSDLYKLVKRWLGTGLLTSGGNKWRKHRKIITPAFHFQILEEFIDVFNSASDVLVEKLNAAPNKASIDIYPFIARCTLDIICETAMGTSVNAQNDIDSEYVNSVKILLGILVQRSLSPILANDLLYPFTTTYQKEKAALKVVHGYTKSVISKRKVEFYNNSKTKDENVDSYGRKKKRAFLDLLLEYSANDPSFTEEHIQEEVDTFMFEGHDTTATSITFALYALAMNPHIQEKAYAELKEIFSDDSKRHATYRDLQEMKYLEMVIKETLRIYTTVPFYSRALEKDVNMNGQIIPKGTMLNVFAYGIHHNPKIYKDPEIFDPERFSIENSKKRSPFAFIPFSAGPRNCIGQKFAMLEMKSSISDVLRNFKLLPSVPAHKVVLKSEAVLKSDNGVFVRLEKRMGL